MVMRRKNRGELNQWDVMMRLVLVLRILASSTRHELQAGLFDGDETHKGMCAGGHKQRTQH